MKMLCDDICQVGILYIMDLFHSMHDLIRAYIHEERERFLFPQCTVENCFPESMYSLAQYQDSLCYRFAEGYDKKSYLKLCSKWFHSICCHATARELINALWVVSYSLSIILQQMHHTVIIPACKYSLKQHL